MNMKNTPRPRTRGFTIVEMMFSITVLVVGILGLASAGASITRYQTLTSARAEMALLADGKFEQLRGAAASVTADTAQLNVGGSLTLSLAPHFDSVVGASGRTYIRRWQVVLGPGLTRSVTLRIVPEVDVPQTPAQLDFSTLVVTIR